MAKTYGTEQRTKPRLRVLRGWDPNNPSHRSFSAPITSDATIKSGQLVGLRWNNSQEEFALGLNAATDVAYFAVQDSDDFDVVASGKLTALSSADQIEIQTPYYTADAGLVFGARLSYDSGTPGNVKLAAGSSAGAILGYISRGNGPVDIRAESSEAVSDGSGTVLVLTIACQHQVITDVTP